MNDRKQVVLIIFDGWGYREEREHNAIAQAQTSYYDSLWELYPHTFIEASGEAVGLPEGTIGSSEIGHMILGAGKAIDTNLVRINKAARNNGFNTNAAFQGVFEHVKSQDATLHIMGQVSPGGVHSHQEHLFTLLKAAKAADLEKVAIHVFTDGRDTPPQSGSAYLKKLESVLAEVGIGRIATATGRYYAMDRDNNWERARKTEDAIFHGKGIVRQNVKTSEVMEELYKTGQWDEHFEPMVFLDETGKGYSVLPNDGIIFFNFRPDRARLLSQIIIERKQKENLYFVTMTEYDKNIDSVVAFPEIALETTLAKELSDAGLSQSHIAETEKYAHCTYFFNGGIEEPFPGEVRRLIESRKGIKTHDEAPQMRAAEIAEQAVKDIEEGFDFIVINFANADMVGHTANHDATVKAVEAIDPALKLVVEAAHAKNSVVIITADHGNAEYTFHAESQTPHTAHTLNPVPLIITKAGITLPKGELANVAPTILDLLGLQKPTSMTGTSLIKD